MIGFLDLIGGNHVIAGVLIRFMLSMVSIVFLMAFSSLVVSLRAKGFSLFYG